MHERCGMLFGERLYDAGASSKLIGPLRRQPMRRSQVRGSRTGVGPRGASTRCSHPPNHAPEEQVSISRPVTWCFRPFNDT